MNGKWQMANGKPELLSVWIALAIWLTADLRAADINKGHTFTDGDTAYAGDFNDFLDLATINTSFFTGKSATTTPAAADTLLTYNASAADFRKVTLGNLVLSNPSLITGQTEDTTPATNDFLLSYDTSASGLKKVQAGKLIQRFTTNGIPVQVGSLFRADHGFPGVPQIVEWKLVCTNASGDATYLQGDEIPVGAAMITVSSIDLPGWAAGANSTNVFIGANSLVGNRTVLNKDGSGSTALTYARWNFKCNALYLPNWP